MISKLVWATNMTLSQEHRKTKQDESVNTLYMGGYTKRYKNYDSPVISPQAFVSVSTSCKLSHIMFHIPDQLTCNMVAKVT